MNLRRRYANGGQTPSPEMMQQMMQQMQQRQQGPPQGQQAPQREAHIPVDGRVLSDEKGDYVMFTDLQGAEPFKVYSPDYGWNEVDGMASGEDGDSIPKANYPVVMDERSGEYVLDAAAYDSQMTSEQPQMAHGGKFKVMKKFENGGVNGDPVKDGDPKKPKGSPYVLTKTVDDSNFESKEGMTETTTEGAIPSYNPESGLDNLTQEQKDLILNTEFGRSHLSGEGSLSDQYADYTVKVNDYLNNNRDAALDKIKGLIDSNPNFKTKLEGKSDDEMLTITRDLMTDGKIGDFHGAILREEKKYLKPLIGGSEIDASGIRADAADIIYGFGDQAISENAQADYRAQAQAAGLDLLDERSMSEFFNLYISQNPASTQRGEVTDAGFTADNIATTRESAEAVAFGSKEGINENAQTAKNKNALTVELQNLIQARGYDSTSAKYKAAQAEIDALQQQITSMAVGGRVKLIKSFNNGGKNDDPPKELSLILNGTNIKDMDHTTKRRLFNTTLSTPNGNFSVTNPNFLGRMLKKYKNPKVSTSF